MKKLLSLIISVLVVSIVIVAQENTLHPQIKPGLKSNKKIYGPAIANEPVQIKMPVKKHNIPDVPDNTDVVSIIDIGSSANAYGYGYAGGQKSLLSVNQDLNMVTNFHRMGGDLDPGGYSGDLGYDVSIDGGLTFNTMIEIYVCTENAGGQYFLDAARYPNHGVYNPAGNTDPNNAILAFFAPNLDGSNSSDSWGGYSYGIHHIGSNPNVDTTKNLISSDPADGKFQYIPDGFCMVNPNAEYWVADLNQDWSSGALVWLNEMIISHGVWDEAEGDFVLEQMILECETTEAASRPALQKVEFSPDGQTGYIAVLADNGSIPISANQSYYPILWRTNDGGETWEGPIEVQIAGPEGIEGVHNYLSNEEISEIFLEPLPERDEIQFTTAYDFDLSVDALGNPHIAVFVGVSSDPYSILTGISPSSGYAYTAAFLLSSYDKGNTGNWVGYELGRPVSFRGNFGDLTEDNRIQIARNHIGTKMFVSWLDTDTTVSAENNAPDIWARGVDIFNYKLTANHNGQDLPDNVTFGSEATFSAYFFAMGNEVFSDGDSYNIPYTYENMTPTDPAQPVQFKYIQDFIYNESDFTIPFGGTGPLAPPTNLQASVSNSTVELSWNAPQAEGLTGYLVYRDGIIITPFQITNTYFTNSNVPEGLHTYYVVAKYEEGTSGPSNVVTVNIQFINPEFFQPVWTSPYNPMTIYVLSSTIDGDNMQPGDEIGIFDIDPYSGEDVCVGAGILSEELNGTNYLEIITSMDDGSNPDEVNGFTPGNSFIFKQWNESLGEISNVSYAFPYPGYDETFAAQGSAFVEISGQNIITQSFNLTQGWNIFSCRAVPDNLDMLNIVQPLINQNVLVKVLDEDGGSIFHLPFPPPNGQWSNTIGEMQNTEGYYMKVSEESSFIIEGSPVETPLTIPLTTGWNIISYPCEIPQDALTAVQELIDQDVLVKVIDQQGGTIFHLPFPPPNGQWSNTIGNFEAGQGYYLKVSTNASLTISCPVNKNPNSKGINPQPEERLEYFNPVYENNPYNPMHFAVKTDGLISEGDEIAVYDGDVCVGAAVYHGNPDAPFIITTSMDDPDTEIQEGFINGNSFALFAHNHQSGELLKMDYNLLNEQVAFEKLETSLVEIIGLSLGINSNEISTSIVNISPNPFKNNISVGLYLINDASVKISIKSLEGELLSVKEYEKLHHGNHNLHQDFSTFGDGVFVLIINISEGTRESSFTRKVVKL
jgi:hypothetical protein